MSQQSSRANSASGAWSSAVLLAASALAVGSAARADEPPSINVVEFKMELNAKGGQVRCALFERSGWLKKPVAFKIVKVKGDSALCVMSKIPAGTYGISAFHDLNSNGKLDTNIVGYPTEPYCASRNARNLFSAPSFDDAKFEYRGGLKRLEARMK
jgi:uncharacterized protein (DUF2141 family)